MMVTPVDAPPEAFRPVQPFAIWLRPSAETRTVFASIINELSDRFGTTRFEPHVTVCSGSESLPAPGELPPIGDGLPVRFVSLGCGSDHFHALFVRVESVALTFYAQRIAEHLPFLKTPRVGFHVSLVYGTPGTHLSNPDLLSELADRIPRDACLDSATIAYPTHGNWLDIPSWRTME